MAKNFRSGERVKIVKENSPASGCEGTVVGYNYETGLVHVTLDQKVKLDFKDSPVNRVAVKESDIESLEPSEYQELYYLIPDKAEVKQKNEQPLTLKEAFAFEQESKKAKFYGQAAQWKTEGRCPHCGEKGRISHGSFVCSMHGVY